MKYAGIYFNVLYVDTVCVLENALLFERLSCSCYYKLCASQSLLSSLSSKYEAILTSSIGQLLTKLSK